MIAGVFSAIGSLMIYASSVWIDPPGWVRIPLMAMFPIGLLLAMILGLQALKGRGRALGIAGLAVAAAGLALFIYAITTLG